MRRLEERLEYVISWGMEEVIFEKKCGLGVKCG